MLTGKALTLRARELSIPGRSRMSADELRAAIAAMVPPFRARNGKHKPSAVRRYRRRSI